MQEKLIELLDKYIEEYEKIKERLKNPKLIKHYMRK